MCFILKFSYSFLIGGELFLFLILSFVNFVENVHFFTTVDTKKQSVYNNHTNPMLGERNKCLENILV